LAIAFLTSRSSIAAIDATLHISQYAHTAWRVQDGIIDVPSRISQTGDGYLWLEHRMASCDSTVSASFRSPLQGLIFPLVAAHA
jgi:ligand-binding sensor domain-containing protein